MHKVHKLIEERFGHKVVCLNCGSHNLTDLRINSDDCEVAGKCSDCSIGMLFNILSCLRQMIFYKDFKLHYILKPLYKNYAIDLLHMPTTKIEHYSYDVRRIAGKDSSYIGYRTMKQINTLKNFE